MVSRITRPSESLVNCAISIFAFTRDVPAQAERGEDDRGNLDGGSRLLDCGGSRGERRGSVKVIYRDGIFGIILCMDSQTSDSFDDLWELPEYSVREARVLRSFLEYLRLPGDPQDKKLMKIQNWKSEVGLQLGNPQVTDEASQLFRTLRGLPQELRSVLVQKTLANAHSIYFQSGTK